MLKIGLTGNMGSGKTLITRLFESLGIPVFISDTEARKLFEREDVKNQLRILFGDIAFDGNNQVNRKAIASVVFNNKEALQNLNNIIHPLVQSEFLKWGKEQIKAPYIIEESAILFEIGIDTDFDKTITIAAPEHICIKRIMNRDKIDEVAVKKRLENQWSIEKKIELSDFVIVNDGEQLLIPQVMKIHKELLLMS